jgi:hypothetical protein
MLAPMMAEPKATTSPTSMAGRTPQTIWLKTSRPSEVVPSQCFRLGSEMRSSLPAES